MKGTALSSDPGGQASSLLSPLLAPVKKPAGEAEAKKLCIDDMLQMYCGEFGQWQLRHFLLASLAWALEAFHTMIMIFTDREPAWHCLPGDAGSGCDPTARSVCDLPPASWAWTGGAGSSTVSEWGLVCSQRYKVGLVQAIFFGGCMIGAGIFGHLSDSFLGRKGSLTVVCILNAVFGCLTAFSPDFFTYATLRFLTGLSAGGVGLCCFVLATEPVGPTKRGAAGMSSFYFFSAGIALLSVLAYALRSWSWRVLYVASSVPSLFFLFILVPLVSESPRWYLVRGKVREAMTLMRMIAAANGKCLPEGVMLAVDEDANKDPSCDEGGAEELGLEGKGPLKGSLMDVIRSPVTRSRLFLAVIINFTCSVVYYGLSLNVVNLNANLYLMVLVNAVAETPAYLLTALLLDRYGRRPLGIGTQCFSGLFCLLGALVRPVGPWKLLRLLCAVLGVFGMAGTYNLLFIYTTELFPTVVRNAALGCSTQAVQLGAILAPLVVISGGKLPFLVFAVCGLIGGVLACFLPETLNKPLYDTMAGMEEGEGA